jgi:peroxiredoxin
MEAWAKDQKTGLSLLQLMGDPKGELTKALDVELTHPGPIDAGIIGRCKRHAIYAVNGEIKAMNVAESEDDPAGDKNPESTLADAMLEEIRAVKAAEGE